jgi:hypothetical protein
VEELAAELRLEAPDLRGERGLGDVEPLGAAAEVQLLGDGQEVPEMPELELHELAAQA